MCVYKGVCLMWGGCNANQWSPSVQSRAAQCLHTCPSFDSFCSTSSSWLEEKKNLFSSQWRAWEQEEGSESVLLRGPGHSPFFLYTRQEDHDIRSALTKLERWRPEHSEATSIAPRHHLRKVSFHLKRWGGGGRRGIDSIFCTIMHRQRTVMILGFRWL